MPAPQPPVRRRPASRQRGPRVVASLAALLVTALAVTGCSLAGASGTSGSDDGGVVDTTPLSKLDVVAHPRDLTGPSTARLAKNAVDPVAKDPKATLPATVTDAQGTKVTVTDTSRILALDLYGSTSRIVYDLGLGDRVVGRDVSSAFDGIKDKPLVTQNGHDLNAEAILELAPTVIITDTSLGPWDVVLQMRDAGIPVVVVDSKRNLDNVGTLVHEVADALGVPEQGDALAERTDNEIKAKTAEIAAIVPKDVAERPRIVFLYVRGQAGIYYMFGKGSGADSLIDSIGGVDVASQIGWKGMKPINDEGLVKAAPDVILMMTKGLESVGGVDGLLEKLPAVAQTPAGKHHRIVDMDDTEILSFGPETANVLDAVTRAVYAPGSAK
ncbi:ABC transporter substrate-binding protein [Luteimicrobium album]|uniref:ABC transporter substrate-binding protein n=1 Tax=Luteimicrobium album TaxID=1054550 RepID=A0ABQ6I213_9MICO|nr:ABC transporter substrate-binding protein [Luteimicrobium album]GMA24272.1 ABC transporter substrate-binding protein [Luteimicrobium album]